MLRKIVNLYRYKQVCRWQYKKALKESKIKSKDETKEKNNKIKWQVREINSPFSSHFSNYFFLSFFS